MEWETVIGLEVHIQLNTKTKIFCSCSTEFGAEPNTNVCPVCMGFPGVLPVFNEEVLHKSVVAGLALNCRINKYSKFDRKNYFYPDLPKGYQISQYDFPIAVEGYLEVDLPSGETKKVRIIRAHMEEDAGKLVHSEGGESFVDFNRAGVPLLEIVSYPDIRSPEEAYYYLITLRNTMKYAGVSDVNMEEGSLRCDANISIRPKGSSEFGTRVEIKNLNSFNGVRKALEYEEERQRKVLESGGTVIQETRLYDANTGTTISMRRKEESHDYRYFPEPDLPPIQVSDDYIEKCRQELPELPVQRRRRIMKEYDLPFSDADVLISEKELADYFEETVKHYTGKPKKVANWILSEMLGLMHDRGVSIEKFPISPVNLAELLNLVENGTISGKIAKTVFPEMFDTGKTAKQIVEEKGLVQVGDRGEIEKIVKKVLDEHPKEVEKYKAGKKNIIGFFVGQVMRETKGRANPKIVNEVLRELLGD